MRAWWVGVLLAGGTAAACSGDDGDFPINPGGGGGGGSNMLGDARRPDAPPTDGGGDASAAITGRLCVVTDLRRWTTGCAPTAGDLTVTLDTGIATTTSTMTSADGSFSLAAPGTSGTLEVSGDGIVTTRHRYAGEATVTLTAPTVDYWNDVAAANGIIVTDGNGSALVRFFDGANPRAGVVALSSPSGSEVHYDGADAVAWDVDATGAFGLALLPNLPTGPVTVTGILGTEAVDVPLVVAEDAITFARGDLP